MKIAFLCSSLERGLDGVGDYTRRLAGELIRQGHPTIAVALNDSHVPGTVFESQEIEGTSIAVMRLPSVMPWSQRITEACKWVEVFNPEWMSLQFVPFGFHPKGICFGLGKWLERLRPMMARHVMFHELWLGLGQNSPIKHRVWGAFQRLIILDFLRRLRPRVIHTQTEAYQVTLRRQGIAASILPLFGNIPQTDGHGWIGLLEPLVTRSAGMPMAREAVYLAGAFGRVPPEWDVRQTVELLSPLVERSSKRLVLVFFGRNHLSPEAFARLKTTLPDRALVIVAGERSDQEISLILQTLDLGIATTPRQVIQKSGSTAAMLEHGLPVLVARDDWRLAGHHPMSEEQSRQLLSPNDFRLLKNLPKRASQGLRETGVKQVAQQLLKDMTLPPATNNSFRSRNFSGAKALET